jgi:hypothetical protein
MYVRVSVRLLGQGREEVEGRGRREEGKEWREEERDVKCN